MKVLVVGAGGREHALVRAVLRSSAVERVYCAPGNAGIAGDASCVEIDASDVADLADFAAREAIDLTVVGPELPLTLGIVDEFDNRGLRIVGPRQAAAQIEGSKIFAKQFMQRWKIPTAAFRVCVSAEEAAVALGEPALRYPIVVKADGLAAGKGVLIAEDRSAAEEIVRQIMVERRFGNAGERILLEEFLVGREVSIIVLVDGKRFVPFVTSQDYKRIGEDDVGPNTGGMGCYSPSVYLDRETFTRIQDEVVAPTIEGLAQDGREYRGFLYAGLMLTEAGPRVLEFNVRMGDPETQVILPRLEDGFVEALVGAADGDLSEARLHWRPGACVCVVLASEGYPGSSRKGVPIHGVEEADADAGVEVFHAGTARDAGGELVTAGGRVLGVTAAGSDLRQATDRAYAAVAKIRFDGAQYRRDIAADALRRLAG